MGFRARTRRLKAIRVKYERVFRPNGSSERLGGARRAFRLRLVPAPEPSRRLRSPQRIESNRIESQRKENPVSDNPTRAICNRVDGIPAGMVVRRCHSRLSLYVCVCVCVGRGRFGRLDWISTERAGLVPHLFLPYLSLSFLGVFFFCMKESREGKKKSVQEGPKKKRKEKKKETKWMASKPV